MALQQPKKPVGGAFGVFVSEKRPEFTKKCEGQPVSAVSKMAGETWKAMGDAEKKPYQEKYVAAKAKFDTDMAAFLAAGGEKTKGVAAMRKEKRQEKEGKKPKKAKDPNMPKRPAGGGYGKFLAENREKIVASLPKDHKMTDVGKAAGAQWKALSDDAKKPYEAAYAAAKAEYEKAMEEYKAAHPDAAESEDDGIENEEKSPKKSPEKKSPVAKGKAKREPTSSTKREKPSGATKSPPGKRGRKGAPATTEVEIDGAVLKEAEALKFASQLKNLAARQDVVSSGKSHKQMLDALKNSEGLVNKAKAALLGA
jgi:hypothetical protein